MYAPVKKKQKIIDNDMDWTRGIVKLKGEVCLLFSLTTHVNHCRIQYKVDSIKRYS